MHSRRNIGTRDHLSQKSEMESPKATSLSTISMRWQRATGKIQKNNYLHGNCGLSLMGKNVVGVFNFHALDASECQKSLSEK